jgi:hypothetical protein
MARGYKYRKRYGRQRVHRFYRMIDNKGICVYCGVPATGHDHFVPLSAAMMLADLDLDVDGRVLVPACVECNRLAGQLLFPTVGAKRRYVQRRLARKYATILRIPQWNRDELRELEPLMRQSVLEGLIAKDRLEQRLRWRNQSNFARGEIGRVRSSLGAEMDVVS